MMENREFVMGGGLKTTLIIDESNDHFDSVVDDIWEVVRTRMPGWRGSRAVLLFLIRDVGLDSNDVLADDGTLPDWDAVEQVIQAAITSMAEKVRCLSSK